MASPSYLEVAVDAPLGHNRTLTYSPAPGMRVGAGSLVWVPLLNRPVQGIVLATAAPPPPPDVTVRQVLAVVAPGPLIPAWRLDLARWLARRYRSTPFEALSPMLPPGYKDRVRSSLHPVLPDTESLAPLGPSAAEALAKAGPGGLPDADLRKLMGIRPYKTVTSMLRAGHLHRTWELPRPRITHRYDCHLRLALSPDAAAQRINPKAHRQQALLAALTAADAAGQALEISRARKEFGPSSVDALLAHGVIALDWVRAQRRLDLGPAADSQPSIILTSSQEQALAPVLEALADPSRTPKTFLLHGVTGSGKTEIYLRALEACRQHRRQGILLAPEIALTPQLAHRLSSRFGSRVALMHSAASRAAMFDQWWRIQQWDFDVVLGPRSALFAPLPDPGLIVLDEEHEWNYKEQERPPRYHARDLALQMARLTGAVVILGSATPDVATYHNAQSGPYRLLRLPQRPALPGQPADRPSTSVEVCDMRSELREGNSSIFSRSLTDSLCHSISQGHQAVLFLNRRGASAMAQCRDCGQVVQCRRCSLPLSFHSAESAMVCHGCGRSAPALHRCGGCGGQRLRHQGLGVQRVADEAARLLPGVPVARWDSDAAPNAEAHQRILADFQTGKSRVLVGTQMVAKGLDVPAVSLVGVVLADVGLTLPDFRAGERVFQLLCQVVGRAGRGQTPGHAIIQTYSPQNYAIQAAAAQDYDAFYQKELAYRQQQGNPPFGRLAQLTFQHSNATDCQRAAAKMGRALRLRVSALGLPGVQVVGPAPGYPERLRGRHRWHLLLRGGDFDLLLDGVDLPPGWTLDIDPVSVL